MYIRLETSSKRLLSQSSLSLSLPNTSSLPTPARNSSFLSRKSFNPRRLHKELIVPLDVGTDQLVDNIDDFLLEILLLGILAIFNPFPLNPFVLAAAAFIVLNQ
jgi:hypothetical protein